MRKHRAVFLLAAGTALIFSSASAQEKNLDELLKLDLSELLSLKVVSALKVPETINRTPATVRVITAQQIRDNGYFTLEDALAALPGIQFRNILGFNSYSFIRGVPSQNNKILVLVDGVQVNELNSGGFYGGLQYNLNDIDRIEVVYGPASALYGTNAVSGIISIITRDVREGTGGRIDASLGRFGTWAADARYTYYDKAADFGFKAAAMYKTSEKADLKGEAGDGNWTEALDNFENAATADFRVRYKNFDAGLLFQDKDASYATTHKSTEPEGGTFYSDHGVNWHIRFINAWLRYVLETKKSWSFRSLLYFRNTTVLDDTIPDIELATEASPGRQSRYYRPNDSIGNENQFQWNPGPGWRFSFGLVLEQERLAKAYSITRSASAGTEPSVPARPDMRTNRLISGYAQARITLAPPLDLFAGVRHDDSSYYGTVTTPRLGLVFNREKLTAKLLFGRAFRAPKPWDYTNGLGNPDLEPEDFSSLEFAGAWVFSPFVRLDVALYRNRLSNLLTRINQEGDWWWDNSGSVTTNGGEAVLHFRRGPWQAWASYTYTSSVDDAEKQVAEIAPHGATMGVLVALAPDFKLCLGGRYLGERKNDKIIPATGSDIIGEAFILRAALTARLFEGFDVQLAVENLLDAVYYHPSNLPASRFRQPQRVFRVTAGYGF